MRNSSSWTWARRGGGRGDDAVPELGRVAEGNDVEAARAAIAGLMWSGAGAGHDALVELAEEHPDDSVRMLADVALGRKTGHGHD